MNLPANTGANLTLRQQILREKLNEDIAKVLVKPAVTPADLYTKTIATSGDWLIEAQRDKSLPLALCQLIPLQLRDQGNALIARTVEMNDQFSGVSFRTAEVVLAFDADLLELRSEVIAWGMAVAKEVNYKLRHQAKSDPMRAFFHAFDGFIGTIDDDIAHSPSSIFPFAWSTVVDILVVQLFDTMLLQPGHCRVAHDSKQDHHAFMSTSPQISHSPDLDRLDQVFSLFAIEPFVYTQKVVLAPLLAALRADSRLPSPAQCLSLYQQMHSDLVEAAPYLMSSSRGERYVFPIAGTTCFATINFVSAHGCARFAIADDEASVITGHRSNFYRTALNIGYDGAISWWGHRGRTLSVAFGDDGGAQLSYWLLKQVHDRLVKDYLSIEHYYLQSSPVPQAGEEEAVVGDDALAYVAWAKAADAQDDASDSDDDGLADDSPGAVAPKLGELPHLRRRYFFKLLERCGAHVEQGKGSELKLLRKGKRPFRLGNHGGVDPRIPAFLAADILKRLEITKDEWLSALRDV